MSEESHKNISGGFILGWIFGCIIIIAGLGQIIVGNFVTGIIYLLLSAIVLPPLWRDVKKKLKIDLSRGAKVVIVILGMIVAGIFMDLSKMDTEKITTNTSNDQNLATINEKSENKKHIPGLTAADVTLNFKNQGFTCSDMQQGKIGVTWTCKQETSDHEYTVITFGDSPLEILFVQANVLNYGSRNTNEVSSDFIGYVASLPFDGASPSEAKSWAQGNLGKNNVETKYGEATFRLTGEQETRMRNLLIATDWAIKYGVEN
jgi:hypothetical protein